MNWYSFLCLTCNNHTGASLFSVFLYFLLLQDIKEGHEQWLNKIKRYNSGNMNKVAQKDGNLKDCKVILSKANVNS